MLTRWATAKPKTDGVSGSLFCTGPENTSAHMYMYCGWHLVKHTQCPQAYTTCFAVIPASKICAQGVVSKHLYACTTQMGIYITIYICIAKAPATVIWKISIQVGLLIGSKRSWSVHDFSIQYINEAWKLLIFKCHFARLNIIFT